MNSNVSIILPSSYGYLGKSKATSPFSSSQACLQLDDQGKRMVLNTNDRNLATKAAVSDIRAFRYTIMKNHLPSDGSMAYGYVLQNLYG
jgi:hypothetical protein